MQVKWHDSFHLREHTSPGKSLAGKQLVQELRLIGDIAVLGLVQDGTRLRLLLIKAVDFLPDLRQLLVDGTRMNALVNNVTEEQNGNQGEARYDGPDTLTELPGRFVGLAGEIDVETHYDTKAPTTPASAERDTLPAAAPAMLLDTSSSTRILELAFSAVCSSCADSTPATSTRSTPTA